MFVFPSYMLQNRNSELQRQIDKMRSQASLDLISTERLRHEYHDLLHSSKVKLDLNDAVRDERDKWAKQLRDLAITHREELVSILS